MIDRIEGNADAGFGFPSAEERLKKDIEQTASEIGDVAVRYIPIGVESTGETTIEDRKKLRAQGIASHPIGWGVAFSRIEQVEEK